MKLLYTTSVNYPSPLANRIQIKSMGEAFGSFLGRDFVLGIGKNDGQDNFTCEVIEVGEKVKSFMLAWKYLAYAKENKITHIFCREEKLFFFLFIYNILFRARIKLSYELHYLKYVYTWWFSFVLKRVGKIISITAAMKEFLIELGIPEQKILVSPDAVDIDLFDISLSKDEARNKLGLPTNKHIIVYTGNISVPWKGAPLACEVSDKFSEDILLVVVGGKKHHLEKFKEKYPQSDRRIFFSQITHDQIPYFLAASDILVLPNSSYNEVSLYSTSPMKLFEYMASSRPIVAADIPSVREILNEKNSILFKPDDVDDFYRAIKLAVSNVGFANKVAGVARIDVEQFTWTKRARSIATFIE